MRTPAFVSADHGMHVMGGVKVMSRRAQSRANAALKDSRMYINAPRAK